MSDMQFIGLLATQVAVLLQSITMIHDNARLRKLEKIVNKAYTCKHCNGTGIEN